jgi:hypothetical protein
MIQRISLTCLAAIIAVAFFFDNAWADTVYSIGQDGFLFNLNSDGTSNLISSNGPAGTTLCLAIDSYGNLYTANSSVGT